MEIARNTYKVKDDPEVDKVAEFVAERLKTCGEATVSGKTMGGNPAMVAKKHVAIEVGRMFSNAGYYASVRYFPTGVFADMTVSREPQDMPTFWGSREDL